ncbi:siphovirus ReqiPepy6 Gp37-like family protein [Peribacillus frigoritolerans]|uniref:siphovirus ReqiPepy6 Gp37-like family protein n=1 Tax=Peribacillus frigoritolerans TaxID=450367 RepID=UPI002079B59C|nr:siphovirus ReqiPepy6 Gp37-like family protein [Peribacillus frigoritolerans]USK78954.1 siphovirus ReqiPepy6 Gp37-like family protein [Peribacillus frigoritolerans]
MWYIFNVHFDLQGVMDDGVNIIKIEHHYHFCDVLSFETSYTHELYQSLVVGNILSRGVDKKGYRIHSVEIQEQSKTIIGHAYGLESILDQRVVNTPLTLSMDADETMHELVRRFISFDYVGAPEYPLAKVMNFIHEPIYEPSGTYISDTYYGTSLYSVISELSKASQVGYRVRFHPNAQNYAFETYLGKDLTSRQSENAPVIWRSAWGDTREETFLLSKKDYKNTVFLKSGDDENPISLSYSDGIPLGWDRYEMFSEATDIKRDMGDGLIWSDAQVRKALENRGKLEVYRNFMVNDFTFVLNEDISQVFQIDYNVGDVVSVVNEVYGITKHSRIVTVTETIIQDKSQFEVKFED